MHRRRTRASLLIDRQADAGPSGEAGHAGTNDLDIGLAVALLDEQQYSEIARRLRQEHREVLERALKSLASDLAEPDSLGPPGAQRNSRSETGDTVHRWAQNPNWSAW